jgi:hypothetical protein
MIQTSNLICPGNQGNRRLTLGELLDDEKGIAAEQEMAKDQVGSLERFMLAGRIVFAYKMRQLRPFMGKGEENCVSLSSFIAIGNKMIPRANVKKLFKGVIYKFS